MEQIIELTPLHLMECSQLYSQVFSSPPWSEAWNATAAAKRLQETFATPGFVGIGYFANNQLQGMVLGHREQWLDSKHFYLKEMCVQTTLQSKGIGKKLLQSLKVNLQAQQVQKIYLLTMRDGNAQQFYLNQDFKLSDKLVVMGYLL
jgi:ribosomal protein S18 acetylase RimI-like enzyme